MLEIKARERLLSIGEVAERFGVAVSALRYYDELGILTPADHTGAGRAYGPAELKRLALIQLLQGGQLTLREIADVLAGPDRGRRWHDIITRRIAALEDHIRHAHQAKALLEHARECPRDNPVTQCPYLAGELRERVTDRTATTNATGR